MPAELLRDLVAPFDAHPTRRLSMLPLSIAAHIVAAVAFLIIPLAAEVEPPTPAPLAGPSYVRARAIPAPPMRVEGQARLVPNASAAPTSMPEEIAPSREVSVPFEGGIPGPPTVEPFVPGLLVGDPVGPIAPPPPPPPPPQLTVVRVGQGVREPKKVVNVTPEYPLIARNSRVEGMVILEALIDETGAVDRIKVLKSVALLDGAAIEAVKRWRYTPTLLNGTPVSVVMTITVNFTMNR